MNHLTENDILELAAGHQLSSAQRRHLAQCPDCTQRLAQTQELVALTREESPTTMTSTNLRERLWSALSSESKKRRVLPLRPLGLVSGAALAAGAVVFFILPGGIVHPMPSFASVEEAMRKIQTVHWTETNVTQAEWMFQPGRPSGSHMKESDSTQTSRWDCWARLDSPKLVQKAILEQDKNAEIRLIINPDLQWLYERSKFSFSYTKFPTYLSPEQTIRQRILDQVLLPQDSPGKASEPVASFKRPKVSFSPWRRSEASLRGKSVLVFQRERSQKNGDKKEVLLTKMTVWVDKKTLRILRREELTPSPRGKGFLFKRTAENFRYNELAPDQIFELPKPRVGEPFRLLDFELERRNSKANAEAARALIPQVLDAYSKRDTDRFLALWDWDGLSKEDVTKLQAQWRKAVQDHTPYKTWRYGAMTTGFAGGMLYLRKSETDPFPPTYPATDAVLGAWVTTEKNARPTLAEAVFSLTKRSGQWKIQSLRLSKDPLPPLWLKGKH